MLEPQNKNLRVKWADPLAAEEVNFSKEAGNVLKSDKCEWASRLLKDSKISKALECRPDLIRTDDELKSIKSALFELRFAHAIHNAGYTAKYEYNAGVGNSSVDFRIFGKENKPDWLVELTSLRDSKATKDNSSESQNFYGYASLSVPNENSPEVRDLVKVQQAILHKVTEKQDKPKEPYKPIKFPKPNKKFYSVIIVDVRVLSLSGADEWDFYNIVYGSESIHQINHGLYSRSWSDQNGNLSLFQGIFDSDHPDQKTKVLQKRVHAIGFVSEKEYLDGELNSKIQLFPNQHLITDEDLKDFYQSYPLMLS